MPKEVSLMLHATFGVLGLIAAVWMFVEVLNASADNRRRIRGASLALAAFIWLAYGVGGYWYVQFYAADKALITAGPWPFAHRFFMETKEHLFFLLLLLATYLPIAAYAHGPALPGDAGARRLLLTLAGLAALLALAMDGAGAVVALGAKLGLMAGG